MVTIDGLEILLKLCYMLFAINIMLTDAI